MIGKATSAIRALLGGCGSTRQRPYAPCGTNMTRDQQFASMKLLSRKFVVDNDGRWWTIERRHCLHTGVILERTRRITD